MKAGRGSLFLAFVALAPFLVVNTEEAAAPAQQAGAAPDPFTQPKSGEETRQPRGAGQDALPDRLDQLLSRTHEDFRKAAEKSDFSTVGPDIMSEVPTLVLVHMSAYFLSTGTPRALSAIVRRHPSDVVVASAVVTALDLADNVRRTQFIAELGLKSGLSVEVQAVIAEASVRWWGKDMSKYTTDLARVGSPLLAVLPPGYLAELSPERAANMLLALRNHPWEEPNDPQWSRQPPETRRVWMELFKKDADSGKAQLITAESDGLKMLWAGATPDEINDLQYRDEDRGVLTRLSQLTKLQVRGFLSKLFPKPSLTSVELNDLFDWVLYLSPTELQRFAANDTDFSNLPAADTSRASLPTLKQVLEQVVASDMIQDRIQNSHDPGSWGRHLKDVGRLAYLIRADHLKRYSQERLPWDVLSAVDTYKLSALQARYLTNNGQFLDLTRPLKELETFHGLTRAIPTTRLAALKMSTVNGGVMNHLLESMPATHVGRSAVLFNKLRTSMSEAKVLEAVLRNPEPGQYLSLVSARELGADRAALEKAFTLIKSPKARAFMSLGDFINANLNRKDGIEERLNAVPLGTLSAVLGSARRELAASGGERLVWTSDTLLSADRPLVRGALLGLSCPDVVAMDLVDLPVVLDAFNHRLREAGLGFPKRLHHCVQRALEDYLDVKWRIRQLKYPTPLIAALEPSDIQAFGGYVLATLKPNHIQQSAHAELILTTIGAMSPQELLSAVPRLELLEGLALQLVDLHRARRSVGARCLFALGNLHMFLPPDVVTAIEPAAWKLFVEASAGRPKSLAVCANSEQRDAWHRLAIKTFGAPTQWSPGVVAALGDLLAAMPVDVLSSVRMASWRDAADTLAERTLYHLPTHVTGSDHPLAFVEVCRALLYPEEQPPYYWAVRALERFYLRAASGLLDSVEYADKLVRRLKQRSARLHPSLQPRNAAVSSTTTTTTTPSTTTVEALAEEPSTETSTTTTTTTENPFGGWGNDEDFDSFLVSSPGWLEDMLTTTTQSTTLPTLPTEVAPAPKTVIVHDDETALSSSEEAATTLTPASPVGQEESSSPVPTESILVPVDESQPEVALDAASPTSSSTAAPRTTTSDDMHSADTLPSLIAPNKATANLSVAVDGADKPHSGFSPAEEANLVRRRRGAGDFSDEMEHQIGRDVQLQVTCDAVRTLGAASSLALVLGDPEHMLDAEVLDCIEDLGRLRLGSKLTRNLWSKIPESVRTERVADMGRLVMGMSVSEVPQLNLNLSHDRALDTLSLIGQHIMDPKVLDAVAQHLESQNPGLRAVAGAAEPSVPDVDPDSLLVALGPVLCSLSLDLQRTLLSRRGALLHAARSLQGVRLLCNNTCLGELARAAVSDAALGPASTWSAEDVNDMGVIIAGLDISQLQQLHRPVTDVEQPVSGITAAAVACMLPEQIMALGDHLAMLSPVAASAVTPVHLHLLPTRHEAYLVRIRNLIFTRQLGRPEHGDWNAGGPSPSSATGSSASAASVALTAALLVLMLCA